MNLIAESLLMLLWDFMDALRGWSRILKKKEFNSSIKIFILISIAMYGIYALGFLYAYSKVYMKMPKADDFKEPFLWIMIAAGSIIVIATIVVMMLNKGKKISFTPQYLEYKHGKNEFTVSWKELVFKPPQNDKGIYRTALISDGSHFGNFDTLFFPDFDLMIEVIRVAVDSKSTKIMDL